jgi:hypothetical protein
MEFVIALLLVLAAGWLLAYVVFARNTSLRAKLKPNKYKRVPVIPPKRGISEVTKSAIESVATRRTDEIPLVEVKDLTAEEYLAIAINKPFGEVLSLLVPEILVDGKQTWELAEDAKHDLQKMLECCRAELETMRAVGLFPAPFYFKRAAILFRKQKMYEKEVQVIEFYWRAIDEVMGKNKRLRSQHGLALKQGFEHRYLKAKELLEKQRNRSV